MNDMSFPEALEPLNAKGVDWDDFRVFLEVVRACSFNRAASRLKMTQPTVSRRLMRLEARLGVRLFNRDRRGTNLTPEGQRIFDEASAAQVALMRAASQATVAADRLAGDCKLSVTDGIAAYWIAHFLAPFFERFPGVELQMFGAQDGNGPQPEMFDLQIHHQERNEPEPSAIRLGTVHFMPFASREYLARHGAPRSLDDLGRHRLLDFTLYLADMGSWASWARDAAAGVRTAAFTNLSAFLSEAVIRGAGIALLPTYAVLSCDNLVPLDLGLRFRTPLYLVRQHEAAKKPPVRSTVEFLRTSVFDRKAMPWFRDAFVPPAGDWHGLLADFVQQARGEPAQDGTVQRLRANGWNG